jgi:uncharacterized protein YkwD
MKYHVLGTFCVCLAVLGLTTTAQADINSNMPANQPDRSNQANIDRQSTHNPTPAPSQVKGNLQSTANIPATTGLNSTELAVHNYVNKYRQSHNLPPLVVDPAVSAIAKAHSEQMARSSNMSHDGFNERTDSVSQTIIYRSAAENVGYNMGYAQPEAIVVHDWIASPGHQRNMVGHFDVTGIGVAKNNKGEYYFTQLFIRKAYYVKDAD